MTVLVIAAHPDDEVLGCGGTIARLARERHDIFIAILGEGVTSRFESREAADPTLVEVLHERSRQVAELLGAKDVFHTNLPDNRFDTVPLLEVVKMIEELVSEVRPHVIYTHHGGDLNIDHMILHRAVLTATRPVPKCCVRKIYAFEVPSSSDWAFQQFEPCFGPNVFVDISETLETKLAAMALYETEIQTFPHPRSPDALRANAKRWGSASGLNAAEAFELIRETR